MGYLKCEVFLPESDYDGLIEALNEAKLLGTGNYDYVHAVTQVMGHWRPLQGADPTIGTTGQLTSQPELKLEFRIRQDQVELVKQVITAHHSYETPVINLFKLEP